ncbi:MAG: hypothetical protein D6701_03460 [Gemmatimonadetes bacterium]|nr:MAG: hypothetical protein D6701_03460 [Gemmatimonadota bacterium]
MGGSEVPSPEPLGTGGWTIEGAERLLASLTGVLSARVVARPGGEIDEIHLLTTKEVAPKQTVRNVESALRAHFDLAVDHRKISVAQTSGTPGNADESGEPAVLQHPARPLAEDRILFVGHHIETERSHRVRIRVAVEWRGERFEGSTAGADLPRARYETTASATIAAIESALSPHLEEQGIALSLDGVKLVDAFDQQFVLVAVHAIHGRSITALAGAATVEDTPDRAVILATLQATDRWVRGRF